MNNSIEETLLDNWSDAWSALCISGLSSDTDNWFRNVKKATDPRRGPWRKGTMEVTNQARWEKRAPCLYFVRGNDQIIRYVGKSSNRLKDRWRFSPALDNQGDAVAKQPFHSQCWKHMQSELLENPSLSYEVVVLFPEEIQAIGLDQLFRHPQMDSASHEEAVSMVESLESGIRAQKSKTFLLWNHV